MSFKSKRHLKVTIIKYVLSLLGQTLSLLGTLSRQTNCPGGPSPVCQINRRPVSKHNERDKESNEPSVPTTTSFYSFIHMYLTRSEYDRGVNTFSPEGRLFQVEYAIEAIKLGSTAIGLQTKSGTVLAVEKRLTSSLLEPSSVEKIAEIDVHVGAAMSGLVADARTLVDHARVEAQNHRFTYDEAIGVEALTQGKYSYSNTRFFFGGGRL